MRLITLIDTIGRTPLDEETAPRTDLYLTAHNTHKRERDISVPGWILTRNPSKSADADLHLRPRVFLDGHSEELLKL